MVRFRYRYVSEPWDFFYQRAQAIWANCQTDENKPDNRRDAEPREHRNDNACRAQNYERVR